MAEIKFFRRAMKAALERLTVVGFLSSWQIDGTDKVKVVRSQMLTSPESAAATPSSGSVQ
jgi:hypothetical protein